MTEIPLAVLDLVPRNAGASVSEAVHNLIDLAQQAEQFGYERYWFAEHHLNPGVLGASATLGIALVAGATRTIRLGSAGVQLGHRQPLAAVEEFGLLDALYPGRLDLGLGRSFSRPAPAGADDGGSAGGGPEQAAAAYLAARGGGLHTSDERAENGLLLPKQFDISQLVGNPKVAVQLALLQQPGAYAPAYSEQVSDILSLLGGTYVSADGIEAHAYPGEGAAVQVWILGASGGSSASVAGANGLRFAASYHHSPSTVLDAVDAYRAAFRPSRELDQPYVSVSADVVVGEDDATAAVLASGYAPWVRSIRTGAGAIAYPTPQQAAALQWSAEERQLVKDRTDTQLVGSPQTVADQLEQLQQATGADELAITTITHRHIDRVLSYELLAEEWARRGHLTTTSDGLAARAAAVA